MDWKAPVVSRSESVTVVVTRVVRPGREAEFEDWAEQLDAAAKRRAGHLASVCMHVDQGLNHLIHLLAGHRHLAARAAREKTPERVELIARGNQLSDAR
jgi:antibiotic biosynthesis monooxygenase (ABM) superfamily enzyme